MKFPRDERGQTLVLTALSMAILLGCMALALDVSILFRAKRRVQTAADAAAIAAALKYYYGGTSTQVTAASNSAATANGITDTTQVATTIGPTHGTHLGSAYVEVIITQPNPTIFMATFGQLFGSTNSYNPVNVAARAVAGIAPGQTCMYALDPAAKDALDVQGSAVINAPHCVIQVNSSDNTALCTTGGATINSDGIRIVGAQNPSGKCNKSQANAQTGVNYVADPFAGLATPTCTPGVNVSPATTITQTVANSLPTHAQTTGSGASTTTATVTCFSGSNVTVNDGVTMGTAGGDSIFVFQNGVKLGSATINGTVALAGGSFSQGNNALVMKAPTTGTTYNGIALWVQSTASPSCGGSYNSFKGTPAPGGCLQIQFGSGSANLDGMIYAPAAAVYMQDNGGATVVTAIIADEIYDKSSSLTITNNYNYVHTTSPLNQVSLVE
jgi:Putative Flp pilus-assembly TadE/G-like